LWITGERKAMISARSGSIGTASGDVFLLRASGGFLLCLLHARTPRLEHVRATSSNTGLPAIWKQGV
jgi:hypothetical protein